MKILVNGKIETLTANGINDTEYTNDLIGMYTNLDCDNDGMPIMSNDDFAWWSDVIDKLNRIDEIRIAANGAGREDDFYNAVNTISDCDLDHQTDMQLAAAEELAKSLD